MLGWALCGGQKSQGVQKKLASGQNFSITLLFFRCLRKSCGVIALLLAQSTTLCPQHTMSRLLAVVLVVAVFSSAPKRVCSGQCGHLICRALHRVKWNMYSWKIIFNFFDPLHRPSARNIFFSQTAGWCSEHTFQLKHWDLCRGTTASRQTQRRP